MFQIRPFESKTLSWWHAMRDKLDVSPTYQRRGNLWSRDDKAYLIDSVLNGFDVPKLYVADFTYIDTPLNTKRLPYAIIDGRQRLEAIFDFFDGLLTLRDDFIFMPDQALSLSGLGYKDLQTNYPAVARLFDTFNLSVMSVITDDFGKINELFVRLNRSRPLTGAEIRNAMAGLVPQLFRRLASHEFFENRIRFKTQRGQDRNAAAKFLLVEFRGTFVDTKKIHLDRFVEEGRQTQNADFEAAASRVEATLDRLLRVFIPKDPLLSSEGPLLVYYWFVRARADSELDRVREFLVDFERKRKTAVRDPDWMLPPAERRSLMAYQGFRRSINDHSSMIERRRILEDFWHGRVGQRYQTGMQGSLVDRGKRALRSLPSATHDDSESLAAMLASGRPELFAGSISRIYGQVERELDRMLAAVLEGGDFAKLAAEIALPVGKNPQRLTYGEKIRMLRRAIASGVVTASAMGAFDSLTSTVEARNAFAHQRLDGLSPDAVVYALEALAGFLGNVGSSEKVAPPADRDA
ncbi:MAG: DUF262 domain-containing protein [Thermoanaerobaculia bacterium]